MVGSMKELLLWALILIAGVSAQQTFPVTINFSTDDRTCGRPGRYVEDNGLAFGQDVETGLTFGWRLAQSPFEPSATNVVYREGGSRCLQNGFAYMEEGDELGDPSVEDHLWQFNLPNGIYTVGVMVGDVDPVAFSGDVHEVLVNGVRAIGPVTPETPGQRLFKQVVVRATNGRIRLTPNGFNTKLNRVTISEGGTLPTPTPPPGQAPDRLQINFLPDGVRRCGRKYVNDFGNAYGPRPEGYNYGWVDAVTKEPLDFTANMVLRQENPCVRGRLAFMQPADQPNGEWVVNPVENGPWEVRAVCGDTVGLDSTHVIEANGVRVLGPSVPATEGQYFRKTGIIEVTDNTIRISAENGGLNTKLALLRLTRTAETPSPPPPTPTPIVEEECVPSPSEFFGAFISTLPCEDVLRAPRYNINFRGQRSGLVDSSDVSTEFTMYLPASNRGNDYNVNNLEVVNNQGLEIRSVSGTMAGTANNHQNALGVGLDVPSDSMSILMIWELPDGLTGQGERACEWFGNSESKFAWICVVSRPEDTFEVDFMVEFDDVMVFQNVMNVTVDPVDREFTSQMQLLPRTNEVVARFKGAEADLMDAGRTTVPREFFSFDAANNDFRLGTRSFAGPMVSHASGSPLLFRLTEFDIVRLAFTDNSPLTPGIDWTTSFLNNIPFPTAMVYGPDDKLYITNANCEIFRITFQGNGISEASRETFQPLGFRLCLGIEIDPDSTSENIVLWLSHSDSSQDDGDANSGKVSRVSGENLTMVDDVVIGLPRAIANHAPNQLHFGPDGRLFLTIGSNTGGGAPNANSPTFGFRPEQCLTSALLVMDVKQPGFLGDCTPAQDPEEMDLTGITDENCDNICDVQVFAGGLRNSYDFTWRLGDLWATDNGLGGTGTAPILPPGYSPGASCNGPVPEGSIRAQDPGSREDLLVKIAEGAYYGHPNPARKECIYYGGTQTGPPSLDVPKLPLVDGETYSMLTDVYPPGQNPDPSFSLPELSFGLSRSPNGIISYKSNAFCGELLDDLLVTWYSQFDQIRWLHLNAGGNIVRDEPIRRSTLESGAIEGMKNPLCLTQNNLGDLFVGEFVGSRVRVFRPLGAGCSRRTTSVTKIHPHLDSAGAAAAHKLYVFGGADKSKDGIDSDEVHVYDARKDSWKTLTSLPKPARAMAAVSFDDRMVFAFGGFHGDAALSSVLSVHGDNLEEVATLPSPVGGASAGRVSSEGILIAGGSIVASGTPTSRAWLFNPATKTISGVPSMREARMYASAVSLNGALYICGGVGGDGEDLASCETFDGRSWSQIPDMPSPRSRAGAVIADGKIVIKGGQNCGKLLRDVQEYDPKTQKWRFVGNMRIARAGGVISRIADTSAIYSFGGETDISYAPHGEIFEYM